MSEGASPAMESSEPERPSWWRSSTVAVVALAVAVRVAWAMAVPVVPVSDGEAYDLLARNMVAGIGYAFEPGRPSAYWPVGTSAIYAALYAVFGTGHGPIVVLNIALGVLAVLLTTVLARDWFGPRAGLAAGVLMAVWPGQVEFVTVLASELPFNACYLIGVYAATRSRWSPMARVALAGVSLAAACYVRPIALLLPIVIAWCRLVGPGGGGSIRRWLLVSAETAGTLAVMLVLIAPWTWRNANVFGQPVLISTNGGANLWMGNNPETTGSYMPLPESVAGMNEVRRDALLRREATRYIQQRPGAFVRRTLMKLVQTYERETIGVVWNRPALERAFGPSVLMPLKVLSTAYWALAMLLGLAGAVIALGRFGPRRWLGHPAVVLWAYFAALHAVIVAGDRYHYPSVPMIAALAGLGAVGLLDRVRRPRGRSVESSSSEDDGSGVSQPDQRRVIR